MNKNTISDCFPGTGKGGASAQGFTQFYSPPGQRFIAQFLQFDMWLCVLKTISQIGQKNDKRRCVAGVCRRRNGNILRKSQPSMIGPWLFIRSVTIIMIPSLFNATLRGIKSVAVAEWDRENKFRKWTFINGPSYDRERHFQPLKITLHGYRDEC